MKLVLDLLGPPRLMGARHRCELRSGSLAIGRSPEADWVIPDANRLISRRHLRVDASHGDFVLTDTSANGVYINHSDEPVGFGACVSLQNGDKLRVGEAEIAVSIESDAQSYPAANDSAPHQASHDPLDGPFGATSEPAMSSAASSPHGGSLNGSRHLIDAGWMNEPEPAPPPPMQFHPGPQTGPLPPSFEASPPVASRPVPASAPIETLSLLQLVDMHPDLTLRRLAAAVDAAGETVEASEWLEFRKRINQFMRKTSL